MVELRRLLLLPLDDLLVVTREFINPAVSRSGLDRCLQRHGVGSLRELQAEAAGEMQAPPKSFKDYVPGFVQWTSSTCRRCLTRWLPPTSCAACTTPRR
ncbi:MAG: hypothetical protein RL654_2738 [Pseudomonadota bacterium]